jgi:hypothetical protein
LQKAHVDLADHRRRPAVIAKQNTAEHAREQSDGDPKPVSFDVRRGLETVSACGEEAVLSSEASVIASIV